MSEIVFEKPDSDAPGFLRRQRQALEFKRELENAGPDTLDKMVEFLLAFVTEPEDRDEARDALWDASERQFNQLLDVVTGRAETDPLAAET